MEIEVLVASMKKKPENLIKDMNISTNAIIANQTDILSYEKINKDNNTIKIINTPERGVGRNRNISLDRSSADICILADDDQTFVDDYDYLIKELYVNNPDFDVIIFNVESDNPSRHVISKKYKVNKLNFMRFGAARISFRRKSVTKHGIHFNIHFGGGTEHSAGEDVLFLKECLDKGLSILAVDVTLAYLDNESKSSWFNGYNEKYFEDRGVLYATLSSKFSYLLCLSSVIRHYKIYKNEIKPIEAYKSMIRGVRNFKNSDSYL